MPRLACVLVIGLLACLSVPQVALGEASTSNEAGLACKTVPAKVVKANFGSKYHVIVHGRPVGVGDEYGGITSTCIYFLFRKPPGKGVNPFGGPPHYTVRRGFGQVVVSITSQDPGPEGENWDAEEVNRKIFLEPLDTELELEGGGEIDMPAYGQSAVHAFWVGNKEDSAEAYWRHGDHGFIEITMQRHGECPVALQDLAAKIVPGFYP